MKRQFLKLLSIAALGVTLIACGASTPTKEAASSAPAKSDKRVIAMVGDSITFDGGDSNEWAWIHRLRKELGDKYDVRNYGVNGATALKQSDKPYWQQKAYTDAMTSQPDVVFIMLGTNDSKDHNWKGAETYKADYYELVDGFQSLPSKPKVYIGLNPPAFSREWSINGEVIENEIHPAVKDISYQTSTEIVDYYSLLKDKKEMFPDGIHPNYDGGNLMVNKTAEVIRNHFNK